MFGRLVMYAALLTALGIVVVSACTPERQSALSPTLVAPSPSASRSPTPAAAPAATLTARPSGPPTGPASPGSSPAAACPRVTGGGASNQAQLVAVRVAHQAGFDRLVFEFGPSTAPGPFGIPAYIVEAANSLSGPSRQPGTIAGTPNFGTRFQNASNLTPSGPPNYTGG